MSGCECKPDAKRKRDSALPHGGRSHQVMGESAMVVLQRNEVSRNRILFFLTIILSAVAFVTAFEFSSLASGLPSVLLDSMAGRSPAKGYRIARSRLLSHR